MSGLGSGEKPYRGPIMMRLPQGTMFKLYGKHAPITDIANDARAWITFAHERVVAIKDVQVHMVDTDELKLEILTEDEQGMRMFVHASELESPAHRAAWLVPEMIAIAEALAAMAAFRPGFVHGRLIPRMLVVPDMQRLRLQPPIDTVNAGETRYDDDEHHQAQQSWTSPEARRGERPTPASDVFQLAMLMYSSITGTRPFSGEHVYQGPLPPVPSEIPEPLATLLLRNLSRDPADRDPTPAAFAESLRTCWSSVRERLPATWFGSKGPPRFERTPPPEHAPEESIGTSTHEKTRYGAAGPLHLARTVFPSKTTFQFSGDPVQLEEIAAATRPWLGFSHSRVLPVLAIDDLVTDQGARQLVIVTANDHRATMLDYAHQRWPRPASDRTGWAVEQIIAVAEALAAMAAVVPEFVHRRIAVDTLLVDHDTSVVLCAPVEGYALGKHRCQEDRHDERSLHWMSPEGLRGKDCDSRSDVFELAMQLYAGITGTRPFSKPATNGDRPSLFDLMHAVVAGPPPPRLPVPQPLNDLILRNLSRDPTERDASPAVFAASLRGVW